MSDFLLHLMESFLSGKRTSKNYFCSQAVSWKIFGKSFSHPDSLTEDRVQAEVRADHGLSLAWGEDPIAPARISCFG
jgi:hypothetical protein